MTVTMKHVILVSLLSMLLCDNRKQEI